MRERAVAATALAAAISWGMDVRAVDVLIDDFVFGCTTPAGEMLKPKFGDVGGAFWTGLPQTRKACHETIDRKIYSCRENVSFISHDLNNTYPECLRIFETQARQCVSHFELQRSKCDAGGTGSGGSEAGKVEAGGAEPRSTGADLSGRWVIHNKAAGGDLSDKMVRTCGFGTHNEFVAANGKIHAKVVSGGQVIDDREMVDWTLVSVDPDRVSFRDGDGGVWRYNRCR